jgi:DtxR family Mn-dependent transcriptional regulator
LDVSLTSVKKSTNQSEWNSQDLFMRDVSPNPEITLAMRNYLAEIYRLGQGDSWVSTTNLAETMNVSPPAVARMVKRLYGYGLLEYLPYQGVKLTPGGLHEAMLGIRRHRLVERFLVDVLGFGWHEVHDEADDMQYGISQRIEDRMDELLGHPTRCPHGEPIPSRDGVMPDIDDLPLVVLSPGTGGHISRIKTHDPDKLRYLASLELIPGTAYTLISRQPFNGPIRLDIADRGEQVIGNELAVAIWVTRERP